MLRKWDKMMDWEIANRPLKMSEKVRLAELAWDEFEEQLDQMAKDHHASRYKP